MRDNDPGDDPKSLNGELRDIHHRIDALKSENEQQNKAVIERLHALEVALAKGWRFPVAGWGAVLVIIGAIGATYLKVEVGASNAEKALALIEDHLKQAPTHRYTVENLSKWQDEMRDVIPTLKSDVESLKGRIVGNTAEGWHRRDHELYAESVRLRFENLEQRVHVQEDRSQVRDGWWDQVKAKGLLK